MNALYLSEMFNEPYTASEVEAARSRHSERGWGRILQVNK